MMRFIDSVEHYSNADLQLKWTNVVNAGASVTSSGRHGQGILLSQGILNSFVSKTIDYQSNWYVGWAFKNIGSFTNPGFPIYQLMSNATVLMSLVQSNDSTLYISTNNGIYATTPFHIHPDTWYFIEVSNNLSTSGGHVLVSTVVKINGDTLMSDSKESTINIADLIINDSKANRHMFGSSGMAAGSVIDDIYIFDGQGSINNSLIGDVEIGCVYADGDIATGFSLVPASPTTHFTKISTKYISREIVIECSFLI